VSKNVKLGLDTGSSCSKKVAHFVVVDGRLGLIQGHFALVLDIVVAFRHNITPWIVSFVARRKAKSKVRPSFSENGSHASQQQLASVPRVVYWMTAAVQLFWIF